MKKVIDDFAVQGDTTKDKKDDPVIIAEVAEDDRPREVTNILSRYMTGDIDISATLELLEDDEVKENYHILPISSSRVFIDGFKTDIWLIDRILPSSELSEIFGASGSKKTFLALDMGVCVHNGIPWHGIPVKRGEVLYICGEGVNGVRKRLSGFELHYEVEETMDILPVAIDMMDKVNMKQLALSIGLLRKNYSWIIIDTLNANFSGAENSADDFAVMKNNLKKYIVDVDGSRMVTWIHHTGNSESSRSRGTSARFAGVDTSMQIEKKDDLSVLSCKKMKEADEFSPLTFSFMPVATKFLSDDGETMFSLVPVKTDEKTVTEQKTYANHDDITKGIRLAYEEKKSVAPSKKFEKMFDLVPGENRVLHIDVAKEYAYKMYKTANNTSTFNRWLNSSKRASIVYFYDDFILLANDAKLAKTKKGAR